jgi:putative ribosome biogenesis GTPase RsgA
VVQKIYLYLVPDPRELITIDFTESYFTVGRNTRITTLNQNALNINTLVLGSVGVGKSHLLKNITTDKKC